MLGNLVSRLVLGDQPGLSCLEQLENLFTPVSSFPTLIQSGELKILCACGEFLVYVEAWSTEKEWNSVRYFHCFIKSRSRTTA